MPPVLYEQADRIVTITITQRLLRAIPLAKAMEMILMARTLTAAEALQYGLVNAVVPPADLLATARQWAQAICERGPLAVRAAKEAVITLRGTADAVEGPKAFAEKRKPSFQAR